MDERGEGPSGGDPGEGDPGDGEPDDDGKPGQPKVNPLTGQPSKDKTPGGPGDGAGSEPGQGEPTPPVAPEPKFGQYGDDPMALYKAHQSLIEKTTATETNLSSIRKNLEKYGITVDRDGNLSIKEDAENRNKKRDPLFTDEHRKTLSQFFAMDENASDDDRKSTLEKFVGTISALIDDRVNDFFHNYQTTYKQRQAEYQQYVTKHDAAVDTMYTLYPQLNKEHKIKDDKGNELNAFDETFYNAVTKYIEENPEIRKNPEYQLLAAHTVAIQNAVSPVTITQAKKEGFTQANNKKTIVAPKKNQGVTPPASGGKKGGFVKKSKEEILAMSEDERDAYNLAALDA